LNRGEEGLCRFETSVGQFSLFHVNGRFGFLGAGSENRLSFFLKHFPILRTALVFQFKNKIQLGDFQDRCVSHKFELSLYKGGSHKSVHKSRAFFLLFSLFIFGFLFL
jgi:hypothetical protein